MIHRLLRLYHVYSIDVILGILASAVLASRVYGVHPGMGWYVILLLTAWWIYLTDHLLDGWRLKEEAHNQRHLYFYRNRIPVLFLLVVLTLLNATFVWLFLPTRIILIGTVIGTMVVIYLWSAKFLIHIPYMVFPKEIFAGILFTAGIWGIPFFLIQGTAIFHSLIPTIGYFFIVVGNLFLYSWFEMDSDRIDQQKTLVVSRFGRYSEVIIQVWLGISVLWNGIFILLCSHDAIFLWCGIIFLSMQILQEILFLFRHSRWCQSNYRWYNESIFLLPALILLV